MKVYIVNDTNRKNLVVGTFTTQIVEAGNDTITSSTTINELQPADYVNSEKQHHHMYGNSTHVIDYA